MCFIDSLAEDDFLVREKGGVSKTSCNDWIDLIIEQEIYVTSFLMNLQMKSVPEESDAQKNWVLTAIEIDLNPISDVTACMKIRH